MGTGKKMRRRRTTLGAKDRQHRLLELLVRWVERANNAHLPAFVVPFSNAGARQVLGSDAGGAATVKRDMAVLEGMGAIESLEPKDVPGWPRDEKRRPIRVIPSVAFPMLGLDPTAVRPSGMTGSDSASTRSRSGVEPVVEPVNEPGIEPVNEPGLEPQVVHFSPSTPYEEKKWLSSGGSGADGKHARSEPRDSARPEPMPSPDGYGTGSIIREGMVMVRLDLPVAIPSGLPSKRHRHHRDERGEVGIEEIENDEIEPSAEAEVTDPEQIAQLELDHAAREWLLREEAYPLTAMPPPFAEWRKEHPALGEDAYQDETVLAHWHRQRDRILREHTPLEAVIQEVLWLRRGDSVFPVPPMPS